jgi:adenylate cyclase
MATDETELDRASSTENQSQNNDPVWLEGYGGKRTPIRGCLSIGRSAKNSMVLDAPKVSRRHAIINIQNIGEFWLIDLGSSNGTFLNKRRIHQPVRLCDQDQVGIGDNIFTFHQPEEVMEVYRSTLAQQTIRQIENVPCWLLVADIENFTPLSRSLTSDKLATLIGSWVAQCKEIVESHEGMIDKYLGDGFLAYWREDENGARNVAAALARLQEAQTKSDPRFRMVLHFGVVAIGGVPSMGEESLMGKDVNFVFRMEKVAASLGVYLLTSETGRERLGPLANCEPAGAQAVKGFEGEHPFFKVVV